MKTALQLLSLSLVLFLASCSGAYKLGNTASKDDVYSSSTPQPQTETQTPESYTPQEQTNPNIGSDNAERAKDYSEQRTDEDGDTYVTNNYYDNDNDEDYYYSRRLRRWYEPTYGFGYYSNVYSDPYYWWGPTYYNPGISFNITFGTPWYWHNHHHHYPYYGYSSYYPWYSSYPYYGYYPYSSYGWGYHNGYNNGYWNGYNDGYWGNNYYGYNNYYDYYGGGNGYYGNSGNGYYYGHRGSSVVNTNATTEQTGDGVRVENPRNDLNNTTNSGVKERANTNSGLPSGNTTVGKPEVQQGSSNNESTDKFDKGNVSNGNTQATDKPGVNTQTGKADPINSERVNNYDTKPSQQNQPHKGSTSIDVNPKTQVKPIPDVKQDGSPKEMPEPQSPNKYQWDHPGSNQPKQQQNNQYEAPKSGEYYEYQSPRNNSNEQPQQNDEYVRPREYQQEQRDYQYQPRQYEAPKQYEAPRYEAPKQNNREYEAPRSQPKVEQPKQQNNQPSYNAAPPRSNNSGSQKQEKNSGGSRRP